MEKTNNVSYEHLICLDDVARRWIDEIIVPTFENLKKLYPTAESWNTTISLDKAIDFYEFFTFAKVNSKPGAVSPLSSTMNINPFGEVFSNILPAISKILKAEKQKYSISSEYFLSYGETASLCVCTMYNC